MKKISRRKAMLSAAAGAIAGMVPGQLSAAIAKPARRRIVGAHLSAGTDKGEWRTYGGDLSSQRYSPLAEIDGSNFSRLQPAWTLKGEDHGITSDPVFQAVPLVIKGVMYVTTGAERSCLALDATTGKLLWQYALPEGTRGRAAPRTGGGHGVSYWSDGKDERIFYVTIGYQLICLDPKTGKPDPKFGVDGIVDLKLNDDQDIPLDGSGKGNEIGLHSTPLVAGDVIIVGAAHSATTTTKEHVKGYVRGFDVRTGKRLWIFHTIPKKGEFGYSTWGGDSAEWTGNTGNWSQNSVDPELGLVYLSIEQPTDDYLGDFRAGYNLFADCIVALDVKTGHRVWHYQTVHHDIWDRDNDCPSILCDLKIGGKMVKALCLFTKQTLVFVLDRVTGKPVWPIPEVPVPKGDVPGEFYAPTQPIPTRPPPFDVGGITENDLIDFTPELRQEAVELMSHYQMGPLFNPPCMSKFPGPLGAILNPGGDGAGQWTGGAYDPQSHMAYMFSNKAPIVVGFLPGDPKDTDLNFTRGTARGGPADAGGRGGARLQVQGLPYMKPPYGQITAYNLDKGDIVWQTAHGETPDEVRNHPALKGKNIPRTGSGGKVGLLVTKTVLVAGDGTATTGADGKTGGWLRAYDKATGRELASVWMPARATGCPMTYMVNGRQYIAIGIADPAHGQQGQLAVFSLPA